MSLSNLGNLGKVRGHIFPNFYVFRTNALKGKELDLHTLLRTSHGLLWEHTVLQQFVPFMFPQHYQSQIIFISERNANSTTNTKNVGSPLCYFFLALETFISEHLITSISSYLYLQFYT